MIEVKCLMPSLTTRYLELPMPPMVGDYVTFGDGWWFVVKYRGFDKSGRLIVKLELDKDRLLDVDEDSFDPSGF